MFATIGSLHYDLKCAMLRTFTHEFVHFIEKHNDTEYEAFRDIVFEEMREKGTDPEDLIDAYRMQHPEATDDEASREVVAEAMTDILPQSQFIQKLAQKEPGLFKKLLDRLKAFIKDIKDHFASIGYTASPEVAAVTEDIDGVIRYTEKIVEAFDRIAVKAVENYQEGVPAQKNTAEGGVQYQLRKFEKDGRRFVEIDQDQDKFDGHDISEYPRIAKDIINEKFNGRIIGVDNKMYVNGGSRDEFANPSKRISDDLYEAKMRTAGELDNLLDAGTNFRNAPDGADGHFHKDVIGGFDYFDTLFKIGDLYYAAVINIKNIKKGKLFKDVTKIEDVTQDIMSSYGKNPKSQFLRTSSEDSIRNPNGNVNNNSSDGRHQNQRRTATLSNRMILEKAAQSVGYQKLTPDQRAALDIFQKTFGQAPGTGRPESAAEEDHPGSKGKRC